jgi:hypothetical protein
MSFYVPASVESLRSRQVRSHLEPNYFVGCEHIEATGFEHLDATAIAHDTNRLGGCEIV